MRIFWYWPFVRPEELDWARAVAEQGHELVVQTIDREAAPKPRPGDCIEVQNDLPDVDRSVAGPRWLTSRGRTYIDRARVRRRTERSGDFDVVHYHYPNRFTDGWSRPPGLWVLSVHDVFPHQSRLGDAIERRVLGRLYRRPHGLIVHHEWIRDELIDQFGIEESRIRVVPHQVFPVDDPCERSRPDDGPPIVLFFGALRQNKGLDVLLDAIRSLPEDSLRLHIAGRGDALLERTAAEAAASMPNVTAEVGFVTPERKAELFRRCSVVALPYTSFASQSGVLHDAYGHWRPVVVTDVGALGPTVRHDGTGVVVPPRQVDELASGLLHQLGPAGDSGALAARQIAGSRNPAATASAVLAAYVGWLP